MLARRRLEFARAVRRSGDSREAARLVDDLLGEQKSGPLRADALELRAHLHWDSGTVREAEACCAEALRHVDDVGELRVRVLVTRARVTLDSQLLRKRALAALEALEATEEPDPRLLSEALVALAGAEFSLGRGLPQDLVERALELERVAPPPNVGDRMSAALGAWLKYSGDFDGARHWLEVTRQAALDEGDESSLPYALSHLPQLELWAGDWATARARALEHLDLAERKGQRNERMTAIYNLALVDAHMGRLEEARAAIAGAIDEAEQGDRWSAYQLLSVLGFVELSQNRVRDALVPLERAFAIYEELGAGETPAVFENYSEALVAAGVLETAASVVDRYEERARTAGNALALAPALRCRAAPGESGRARSSVRGGRRGAGQPCVGRDAVQPCADAARRRPDPPSARQAPSRSGCTRGGARDLSRSWSTALGRAGGD